jgi:hypothetical protein
MVENAPNATVEFKEMRSGLAPSKRAIWFEVMFY